LETMNINDYIDDPSMNEIAQNINAQLQREQEQGTDSKSTKSRKKRKNSSMTLTEEEKRFRPRKRHKRNDVSMIEDHYSQKSKFQFDPNQYSDKILVLVVQIIIQIVAMKIMNVVIFRCSTNVI